MPSHRPRPKTERRLNRSQVHEILERNIALYKDEESFVTYLVDLAVYLLEFEYDWTTSEAKPPPKMIGLSDIEAPKLPDPAPKAPLKKEDRNKVDGAKIYTIITNSIGSKQKTEHFCPTCSTPVGDESVCPKCRNLIR